eukprot:g11649.t1 g11649   contig6:293360-294244(+)
MRVKSEEECSESECDEDEIATHQESHQSDSALATTFITALIFITPTNTMYKVVILSALLASSSAFAPSGQLSRTTLALNNEPEIGAGGMADTRNPGSYNDEDPRKSISSAPSFEEYLKQRQADGNA